MRQILLLDILGWIQIKKIELQSHWNQWDKLVIACLRSHWFWMQSKCNQPSLDPIHYHLLPSTKINTFHPPRWLTIKLLCQAPMEKSSAKDLDPLMIKSPAEQREPLDWRPRSITKGDSRRTLGERVPIHLWHKRLWPSQRGSLSHTQTPYPSEHLFQKIQTTQQWCVPESPMFTAQVKSSLRVMIMLKRWGF